MKLAITFKDPDTVCDAIKEAVTCDVNAIPGLSDEEREAVLDLRYATVHRAVCRWFRYSEYVDIEIDTEADTARVVKP